MCLYSIQSILAKAINRQLQWNNVPILISFPCFKPCKAMSTSYQLPDQNKHRVSTHWTSIAWGKYILLDNILAAACTRPHLSVHRSVCDPVLLRERVGCVHHKLLQEAHREAMKYSKGREGRSFERAWQICAWKVPARTFNSCTSCVCEYFVLCMCTCVRMSVCVFVSRGYWSTKSGW